MNKVEVWMKKVVYNKIEVEVWTKVVYNKIEVEVWTKVVYR